MPGQDPIVVYDVDAYGRKLYYFKDETYLQYLKTLRKGTWGSDGGPPKSMSPDIKQALQSFGVQFEIRNVKKEQRETGEFTGGYICEKDGWVPPFARD